MSSPAARLRAHLAATPFTVMPCCFDGLSARLIGDAGFDVTFMSGFAVSATRIGQPDTGLISYGEMADTARNVAAATRALVIGDGDTGYGNALNVKRTVKGYAQAGMAAVMIEDQVAPKRCGHTKGKLVVDRVEAVNRIKAAVDAREEGADILILARTDARHGHGIDEALERARAFRDAGADMLFVEAPQSVEEMETICREVPGVHMANLVEGGATPMLPHAELQRIGYRLAAYPLTLLSAMTRAMQEALAVMKAGGHPDAALLDFADLRKAVGFDAYYEEEATYADRRD
ncbi:oxaloacetate decarboxylase [Stappia sp. MMSF_3263]|uniref:isocitrate lyase/PEP mutase family protein n=1 Tax=Stappia sp. MMSF_3263 TaxID=3046693 RepID=UPI00273D17E7|nr:isocitrate lyase/PEP mutase family protein [Stappia sp. MMSF_3263]